MYIKKEHSSKLELPFRKLAELAAEAIRDASLPEKFEVTVLFDAFYPPLGKTPPSTKPVSLRY